MLEEAKYISEYKKTKDLKYLQELYLPYIDLVYGLGLKYLQNSASAQDLTNDIYLVLAKKVLKHDIENFKPWLYTLTKNHCYDILRKQKAKINKEKDAQFVYYEQLLHLEDEKDKELLLQLKICLESLQLIQYEIVTDFYYNKKSYSHIADEREMEWGSVRSHIQNARRNLKNCLLKNGYGV